MQSACSGGTGTFIEKTARKLQVATETPGRAALRGHEPPQGQQQVRHLRRDRRQHAREDRRAGRGDHREPVRGGGLPEPGHAHQGQHPVARGAAAGRPEPLLPRPAGGVAPPPRQAVGAAEDRAPRGTRRGLLHHGARRGPLLRLSRLRGDRGGGAGRRRGLRGARPPALVGGGGPAGAEGQGGRARAGGLRRRPPVVRGRVRSQALRDCARRRGDRGPGADRLRLRQHHRQGGGGLRPSASCSSPATRCRRATRSRTPSRSSARCARRATATSAASR